MSLRGSGPLAANSAAAVLLAELTDGNTTSAVISGVVRMRKAEDTHVLLTSLVVNVSVLLIGVFLWPFFDYMGWTAAMDHGGARKAARPIDRRLFDTRLRTTVCLNYCRFLQDSRNMFVWLTLVSALFTVPRWGLGPITMGIVGDRYNTASQIDASGLTVMCFDTIVRGLLALMFVEVLRNGTHRTMLRDRDKKIVNRTLWLHGLPVRDNATGQPWNFHDQDFKEIENDLATALSKELNKKTLGLERKYELKVHVAPVVDKWHKVSADLRRALELREAYRSLANQLHVGCCGRYQLKHYTSKFEKCRVEVSRLTKQQVALASERKGLTGAAFVTFESEAQRDRFLEARPKWYECRSASYFTFGRPPFASVTLECQRAPHPTDVAWLNLHITKRQQVFRGFILIILLFIVSFVLVMCITAGSQMSELVELLGDRIRLIAKGMRAEALVEPLLNSDDSMGSGTWTALSAQLPGVLLVVVNSLLLPDLIWRLAEAIRMHRKSQSEIMQLHLNYIFLVINSLLLPALQLSSLAAAVEWGERKFNNSTVTDFLGSTVDKLGSSSGVFFCKYILSAACMTNVNNLLQFNQLISRKVASWMAKTPADFVAVHAVWEFAWGYWYAWAISIYTLGMCLSSFMPGVLPCCALFFGIQNFVDKHNLARSVFSPGSESENTMITRALHYMRSVVAAWWVCMGAIMLFWIRRERLEENWSLSVPVSAHHVRIALCSMIAVGVAVFLWSWYDLQSILHDSNFEEIDVAKRGLVRRGVCACFDSLVNTVNGWLRLGDRPGYMGVDGDLEEALRIEQELDDMGRRGSMLLDNIGAHTRVQLDDTNRSDLYGNSREQLGCPQPDSAKQDFARSSGVVWDARSVIIGPLSHPL